MGCSVELNYCHPDLDLSREKKQDLKQITGRLNVTQQSCFGILRSGCLLKCQLYNTFASLCILLF